MTTCAISVLRCDSGRRATKRVGMGADGKIEIGGYDLGRFFSVTEQRVGSLGDLAYVLDSTAGDPTAFVVRAEPRPGVDRAWCRRLLHPDAESGDPPTLRDIPRSWAILDFDSVPGPLRFDPRDGELAAMYCRTLLPESWRRASCWWGLSSSAGFKVGVRLKMAFWLSRPVMGRELERHLKSCPIDASTLRPVQPIYTARPILVDVADPIRQRSGLECDRDDLVELPELPIEKTRLERATHAGTGQRYVSGAAENTARRRLGALCEALKHSAVGGRHRCLMWASARAVELDDAIPRASIAAELIDAARRAGLEDHEADLARQIRNGFKIGIFGTEAAA